MTPDTGFWMDVGVYVYNGKSWKSSWTVCDSNSFFHSALGVRDTESYANCDTKIQYGRLRWATFLTYFENKVFPPHLASILKTTTNRSKRQLKAIEVLEVMYPTI